MKNYQLNNQVPDEVLLKRLESDHSLSLEERGRDALYYHDSLRHAKIGSVVTVACFGCGALATSFNRPILSAVFFLAGAGAGGYTFLAERAHVETVAFLRDKYGDPDGP